MAFKNVKMLWCHGKYQSRTVLVPSHPFFKLCLGTQHFHSGFVLTFKKRKHRKSEHFKVLYIDSLVLKKNLPLVATTASHWVNDTSDLCPSSNKRSPTLVCYQQHEVLTLRFNGRGDFFTWSFFLLCLDFTTPLSFKSTESTIPLSQTPLCLWQLFASTVEGGPRK